MRGGRRDGHAKIPPTPHYGERAACAGREDTHPNFMFPERVHDPYRETIQFKAWSNRGKAVCAMCPMMRSCEAHGLEYQEPAGIWGGLDVVDRKRIREAENV